MVLLLKGIKLIGVSSASILGTFEPIVSIVMGIIIFKEQLTLALIIGAIFILISTVILAKDKSDNDEIEEVLEEKVEI
ncbi:MAG: EamA family transporter [Romboutsia sp.]|nr:EamA family transporter [Romboutsia sp.]